MWYDHLFLQVHRPRLSLSSFQQAVTVTSTKHPSENSYIYNKICFSCNTALLESHRPDRMPCNAGPGHEAPGNLLLQLVTNIHTSRTSRKTEVGQTPPAYQLSYVHPYLDTQKQLSPLQAASLGRTFICFCLFPILILYIPPALQSGTHHHHFVDHACSALLWLSMCSCLCMQLKKTAIQLFFY